MGFALEDILHSKWLLGEVTTDCGYFQQAKALCSTLMACGAPSNGGIQSQPNQRSDGCFDPGIGRMFLQLDSELMATFVSRVAKHVNKASFPKAVQTTGFQKEGGIM